MEAGTEAETTGECCLLACSSWHAQPVRSRDGFLTSVNMAVEHGTRCRDGNKCSFSKAQEIQEVCV